MPRRGLEGTKCVQGELWTIHRHVLDFLIPEVKYRRLFFAPPHGYAFFSGALARETFTDRNRHEIEL